MRRTVIVITARALGVVLLAALGSQAQSLHPLYKEKDPFFEPALLGDWTAYELKFTFAQQGETAYRLHITELKKDVPVTHTLDFHLVRLGGELYFDAKLESLEIGGRTVRDFLALPVHLLGKISLEADSLTLSLIHFSWVEEGIRSGRLRIPHEEFGGGDILLTASTDELQQLLIDYSREKLDEESVTLRRWVAEPESAGKVPSQ